MKFAFVVSLWFPFGGMQRSLLRIARAVVARGHDVDIYTGAWQGERPEGIGVIELDTRARTNHRSNDRLAEAFAAAIQGKGYHCRVGFTKMPGLDVYYAADPCYAAKVEESRLAVYRLTSRFRAFRRQEAAVFGRGAGTEILLIAHAEREKFILHYGTEPERFHLLPPGINRTRLDQATDAPSLREELGLPADQRMLLTVGSRFHTKGVDRVIRAVAALPPALRQGCRLVAVGHGKASAYRLLARRLGVGGQVHFTGTREDVPRFYRAADLLVHAPRTENTGTVILEAMICGLPALVTGNCGFAHYVSDADAGHVVVEPFDQQRLNDALKACLAGADLPRWRENGPRFCDQTDLYGLIEQAAELIIQRGGRRA